MASLELEYSSIEWFINSCLLIFEIWFWSRYFDKILTYKLRIDFWSPENNLDISTTLIFGFDVTNIFPWINLKNSCMFGGFFWLLWSYFKMFRKTARSSSFSITLMLMLNNVYKLTNAKILSLKHIVSTLFF